MHSIVETLKTHVASFIDGLRRPVFFANDAVELNELGHQAGLTVKGVTVWRIGKIIPAPDHPVYPERYELFPPHPFGAISGMFLKHAGSDE